MGVRYLIDSNSLIEFQANLLPEKGQLFVSKAVDESFNISIINEIEVLGHKSSTPELEEFISLANILDLSSEIAKATVELRKNHRIKLGDAIIEATAMVNGFTLITRNTTDFKNIKGLNVLNPFEI